MAGHSETRCFRAFGEGSVWVRDADWTSAIDKLDAGRVKTLLSAPMGAASPCRLAGLSRGRRSHPDVEAVAAPVHRLGRGPPLFERSVR